MIKQPTHGHRKSTLRELQDTQQQDSPSAAKDMSALALMTSKKKICGNMTLPPMPGHRKPTLGERKEILQSDFLSAAKDISVQAIFITELPICIKISGNIRPKASPPTEM